MKKLLLLSLLLFNIPAFGLPKPISNQDGSLTQLEDICDINSMAVVLPNESLVTRSIHKPITVMHDKDGFMVADGSAVNRVNLRAVDPQLRNMNVSKAFKVLKDTQLLVRKLDNGEYTIDKYSIPLSRTMLTREYIKSTIMGGNTSFKDLKSDGILLAKIGFWIGMAIPHVIQHTSAAIVAIPATVVGGPAGGSIAYGSFIGTTLPMTVATSKALAMGGWIIGFGVGPAGPVGP